jgi:hypothetical protein
MDLFVDVPLWSAPDVTLNQPVRGVFCDARIELNSPSTQSRRIKIEASYSSIPGRLQSIEVDSALADAIGCELTYETKEVQVCQIQRRPNLVRWCRFGDIL